MEDRPDALLKSALEKIVYFEARSEQLQNDLNSARAEADRLRLDLGSAAQREIELRRVVAELEVRSTRSHAAAEEAARHTEALRRERAELIGKMLEASRIHGAGKAQDPDAYDLASFIAALRGEVISALPKRQPIIRGGPPVAAPIVAPAVPSATAGTAPAGVPNPVASPAANVTAVIEPGPVASVSENSDEEAPVPPPSLSPVTELAHQLQAEGRFSIPSLALTTHSRTEETLFGFSVRELSAPDQMARIRAAERLRSLGQAAAAPALAAALHAETVPAVTVVLLQAFAGFAKQEGAAVVTPLLSSPAPEVRIAALKAMIQMDASTAGPHLGAAVKDPDRTVRRRASLLALSLTGHAALKLGEEAIADAEPEVRALAALVLGASAAEDARPLLFRAMRDVDLKVRRAAAQSLSRLLGKDVVAVVGLDDANRRREVRKLQNLPARPVLLKEKSEPKVQKAAARTQVATVTVESLAASLCSPVLVELRAAIRGRTLEELTTTLNSPKSAVSLACSLLVERGQAVARGTKFFVA